MKDKKVLKFTDDEGKEVEYEIITAFELSKTEKNYVVFTDNTTDDRGNLNIFALIYYPDDDTRLEPIETDEEWQAIEEILKNMK